DTLPVLMREEEFFVPIASQAFRQSTVIPIKGHRCFIITAAAGFPLASLGHRATGEMSCSPAI
ncbi:MAG: hypothetical protein WBE38_10150, partial [Terracidiphilus sp.]